MAQNILILGATSAIAAEVARLYAAQGERLYLVGRSPDKLTSLVNELGSAVIGSQACDLDNLGQSDGLVRQAIDTLGPLDIALIAHGLLGDQLRSEQDWPHAEQILRTNLLSAVALLIPLANHFESRGAGHLAAITSVAGERGRPRNYTYGAAKGGLTRYLEGIRSRLYRKGVRVHNLKLGPVDTPMTVDHEKNALFGEKRKVAQGIVRALQKRWHVKYLPTVWAPIMAGVRAVPEFLFQRFGFLAGR